MRIAYLFAMACVAVAVAPVAASAAPVTVDTTRLSTGDVSLEGKEIRFTGEAIGEALNAGGDHRWVNVLSDGIAIGAFVSESSARVIDGYGDYDATGCIVEVTGTYHVACDEHGGDLDVHATELRVISPAQPRSHEVSPAKAVVAFVALGLGIGIWYVRRRAATRGGY